MANGGPRSRAALTRPTTIASVLGRFFSGRTTRTRSSVRFKRGVASSSKANSSLPLQPNQSKLFAVRVCGKAWRRVSSQGYRPRRVRRQRIARFAHAIEPRLEFGPSDKTRPQRDLFGTRNLLALASFDGGDKISSIRQGVEGACVEPREAAPQLFNMKPPCLQIDFVEIGDFQLAAVRRLDLSREFHDVAIIKIEPRGGLRCRNAASAYTSRNTEAVVISYWRNDLAQTTWAFAITVGGRLR